MGFKKALSALALTTLLFFGYQNCGKFAASGAQNLASSNTTTIVEPDPPAPGGLDNGIVQTGAVFKRDPTAAAGNPNLPFTSDLAPYTTSMSISHLKDGIFLSDGFAAISVDDAYASSFASPNAPLAFPPSNPRFQQVNAYYHIDRLINDLTIKGFFPASTYPVLKVNAHCTNGADAQNNSFYSPDTHSLCLGYSDVSGKRIWAADDADVVVHEFGHSLNHKFSTTEILNSTTDLGALDEGFADLWAYQQNQDVRISSWFGRAIFASMGTVQNPFPGLRNLQTVKNYPTDAVFEIHEDSLFLSGAIVEIAKNARFTVSDFVTLRKRILESLQVGAGFGEVVNSLQTEAKRLGATDAVIQAALQARGLYRNDAASELSLDATKPVYVIDNHALPDFQSGGNCNGTLDAGESVFVFPNLANSGTVKGGVHVELATATNGITILAGGDSGYFYRMPAQRRYLDAEVSALQKGSGDYLLKVLNASFAVKAAAGTTGPAHFEMKITAMNTMTATPSTRTVTFDLNVGTAANMTGNCPGSGETSVLP